jgi:hypothetical protein
MLKCVGGLGLVMGMILLLEMGSHVNEVRMILILSLSFIIAGLKPIFPSGCSIIRIRPSSRTSERKDKIEQLD